MKPVLATIALLLLTPPSLVRAAELFVTLPDNAVATEAAAIEPSADPAIPGIESYAKQNGNVLTFTDLKPATPYGLKITLKDGLILRGVNLSWYSREPARLGAQPLNNDDRKQISDLVSQPKSFYNISRIIALSGSHDRATALVERIRSTAFHGAAGDEVIWRVELWYFTNDFGGWSERPQTNKILDRQRFKSNAEYQDAVGPIRWIPALGGIVFAKSESTRRLTLDPTSISAPTTQSAGSTPPGE